MTEEEAERLRAERDTHLTSFKLCEADKLKAEADVKALVEERNRAEMKAAGLATALGWALLHTDKTIAPDLYERATEWLDDAKPAAEAFVARCRAEGASAAAKEFDAERTRLRAEVEALRKERDDIKALHCVVSDAAGKLRVERDAALAQVAALREAGEALFDWLRTSKEQTALAHPRGAVKRLADALDSTSATATRQGDKP